MENDITIESFISRIEYLRHYPNQNNITIILVEGNDDILFYQKFFNQNTQKLTFIPMFGRELVISVLKKINEHMIKGVIGIVDQNSSGLLNTKENIENLFYTDFHDVEIYYWIEEIIFKLLYNYFRVEHLTTLIDSFSNFRVFLTNLNSKVSIIRYIACKNEIHFDFKKIDLSEFIDFKTRKFNLKQYLDKLVIESQKTKKFSDWCLNLKFHTDFNNIADFKNDIIKQVTDFDIESIDWRLLNHGHDLMKVLTKYIECNFDQDMGRKNINCEIIQDNCRLLYLNNHFQSTLLYQMLKNWEKINSYIIF